MEERNFETLLNNDANGRIGAAEEETTEVEAVLHKIVTNVNREAEEEILKEVSHQSGQRREEVENSKINLRRRRRQLLFKRLFSGCVFTCTTKDLVADQLDTKERTQKESLSKREICNT